MLIIFGTIGLYLIRIEFSGNRLLDKINTNFTNLDGNPLFFDSQHRFWGQETYFWIKKVLSRAKKEAPAASSRLCFHYFVLVLQKYATQHPKNENILKLLKMFFSSLEWYYKFLSKFSWLKKGSRQIYWAVFSVFVQCPLRYTKLLWCILGCFFVF